MFDGSPWAWDLLFGLIGSCASAAFSWCRVWSCVHCRGDASRRREDVVVLVVVGALALCVPLLWSVTLMRSAKSSFRGLMVLRWAVRADIERCARIIFVLFVLLFAYYGFAVSHNFNRTVSEHNISTQNKAKCLTNLLTMHNDSTIQPVISAIESNECASDGLMIRRSKRFSGYITAATSLS